MEEIVVPALPDFKLYSRAEIVAVTLLSGPLAGGYMIADNFKRLNDHKRARNTWIITVLVLLVTLALSFFVEQLPRFMLPIIYTVAASKLVTQFQQFAITEHVTSGGRIYSGWQAALIGLIGLAITLVPIILIVVFVELYGN